MSHLLALYLGSLILRSIGIALIAGTCSWKIRNVAIRHAVWVVVLGSILSMPAVDYLLPASWVPARIQQIAAVKPVSYRIVSVRPLEIPENSRPSTPAVAAPAQSKPVNLWNVAAMLYALVAFAMFMRLGMGYRKMRQLRRIAMAIPSVMWEEVVALHRNRWRFPVLLESEAVQVPMTMGLLRPAVILPAGWKTWDDLKLKAVLLHEVAHVRRGDWGVALIAGAVKCAYWLNPVAWFLERRLSQLAEQASDDATLINTKNVTRYAEILLEFAVIAQKSGRLLKGGVAMAQPNMKARIERVLANPQSGTGIVKFAGWAFVMVIAVPVMYSAAALQVASEPVKAPVPTYAAEFGRNPLLQTSAAGPQAAPSPVPAIAPQARQNLSNPSADLLDSFQMELEKRDLQRMSEELTQKLAQAQLAASLANSGPAPDLRRTASIAGSVAFFQDELKKVDERLRTLQGVMQPQKNSPKPAVDPRATYQQMEVVKQQLQRQSVELQEKLQEALKESQANGGPPSDPQRAAGFAESVAFLQDQLKKMDEQSKTLQAAMQQQSPAIPSPPPTLGDALLDLPDNQDDLRAYLTALARLRGNPNPGSYSVSFTGIQGRTVSMKVSGQNFSFGCESCSFFVGESVVSNGPTAPSAPGMFVRLGSDGRDLYITCHAPKCNVMEYEVLSDGTEQVSNPRLLEPGLSELFRTSKSLRVVISKN